MMRSKRAELFSEILTYVNSNDWERVDGRFLVFGASAFWAYLADDPEDHTALDEAARTVQHKLLKIHGDRTLAGRVSMKDIPENAELEAGVEFLNALPQSERERLLSRAIDDPDLQIIPPDMTDDSLDAALAGQLVANLNVAYSRALGLDMLEVTPFSYNTSGYIEEAHYCEMYGQKIAAAILCRAVVEDALKKAIDPSGKLKLQSRDTDESYFESLIGRARDSNFLDHSRIEGAKLIRIAGNKAAHDLSAFRAKYSSRVSELIDEMRKILEDLSKHIAAF